MLSSDPTEGRHRRQCHGDVYLRQCQSTSDFLHSLFLQSCPAPIICVHACNFHVCTVSHLIRSHFFFRHRNGRSLSPMHIFNSLKVHKCSCEHALCTVAAVFLRQSVTVSV